MSAQFTAQGQARTDRGHRRSRRGGILQLRSTKVWGTLCHADENGPTALSAGHPDQGDMEAYSKYSRLVTEVIEDSVPLFEKHPSMNFM